MPCYSAPVGLRSIVINPSVCVSVRLSVCVCLSASISLEPLDRSARICSADPLWLGPPLAALRDFMHFRFYGWRHVWPQWTVWRCVASGVAIPGRSLMSMNALLLRPGRAAEYCDQFVCLSLSLSVCPRAYLLNCWTDLCEICCADLLWLWLGHPLAALRYVMYFHFYGWHHVWP